MKAILLTSITILLIACKQDISKQIDERPDFVLAMAKQYLLEKNYAAATERISFILQNFPYSQESDDARDLRSRVEESILEDSIRRDINHNLSLVGTSNLPRLMERIRLTTDDIKEISWYHDKSIPKYFSSNFIEAYIGQQKNGKPFLRLRIQYSAEDFLFIRNYIIKSDTSLHEITPEGRIKTDVSDGKIIEWYDTELTVSTYKILTDIINSHTSKIRYIGEKYYDDRIITEKEKQCLKNILDAFGAMGGALD